MKLVWQSQSKEATTKKKVTVADALEAMRQNNIPFLSGHLTKASTRRVAGQDVIASACALGQCAINLGANPASLQAALDKIFTTGGQRLSAVIIERNDSYKATPDKAAEFVRRLLTPQQLAQEIEVETEFSVVTLKSS